MCQPLCKLLDRELSRLSSDVKLQTSELAKSTGSYVGLLFVSDAVITNEDSGKGLIELIKSLIQLHTELKLRGSGISSSNKDDESYRISFEVVMIPLNQANCPEAFPFNFNKACSTIQPELSRKDCPFLYLSSENVAKIHEHLARKYEIQEDPSLVLLNGSTAEVILFDAKDNLLSDPKGVNFPWKPFHFAEVINSANLLVSTSISNRTKKRNDDRNNGQVEQDEDDDNVTAKEMEGRYVAYSSIETPVKALLFAAFWCPPCRTFLTTLSEFYEKINKTGKKFEVIFVSSDRSQESFNKFFGAMPWLAIPFDESSVRESLTKTFNVKAIPNLTILDKNDKIITTDGRLEINDDLEGIDFPWFPRVVDELRDRHSSVLNNNKCLIYFTNDTDADYEKGDMMLTPIVIEIEKSEVPEACETKCFIAADSDLAESLRIFMDLDESRTYLVIMDISNFRYAVQEVDENNRISTSSIKDFLHKFHSDKIIYKYIQSRFV